MHTLDLYKQREYRVVKLSDGKDYKLPNEFTVEEVERLLEKTVERHEIENQDADKPEKQLPEFWKIAFEQTAILFQHYQPEIEAQQLKKLLTPKEALELLGFFDEWRHQNVVDGKDENDDTSEKKNLNKS